ncbi:MFS transporter [Amycolatopsis echigonensis]|uniref:MFS transporter n=1 Tax=Amycolatopsis echigonensis TaxID=2576905 RepID=A0A8E2B6K2_9PSEU|nr:MFS transporter [Amycolatopsis echigonensis]MBB2501018.1 MFS transporter [Amycolatopsis echigonensis]
MALGKDFHRLWLAYAVSIAGTYFALDAFSIVAVRVLHSSAAQVSLLAGAGLAAGSLAALPLGPWVEFRRKRPVLIAMDLVRFAALLTLLPAYLLDMLTFAQLMAVSVLVAAANIAFTSASGAYLKSLAAGPDLLTANGRFETTLWTATALGPPAGGAAIGFFGPLATVLLDAVSYLLSALSLSTIRTREPKPARPAAFRAADLVEGWRYLFRHARLRMLFLNSCLVNGLIMATAPLLAVLLLGELGLPTWQYGLAFGVPCLGGLVGSRLARRLVPRYGRVRLLPILATARSCWVVLLAFVPPGIGGLFWVMAVESGLIVCAAAYNTVIATYRLEETEDGYVSRMLSAWRISGSASTAGLTLLWGLVAAWLGTRGALGLAGALMLATPLLLLGWNRAQNETRAVESVRGTDS